MDGRRVKLSVDIDSTVEGLRALTAQMKLEANSAHQKKLGSWLSQVCGCETTNITVLSKRKIPTRDESSSLPSSSAAARGGDGQRSLTPVLKRSRSSCSSDEGQGGLDFQLRALEK